MFVCLRVSVYVRVYVSLCVFVCMCVCVCVCVCVGRRVIGRPGRDRSAVINPAPRGLTTTLYHSKTDTARGGGQPHDAAGMCVWVWVWVGVFVRARARARVCVCVCVCVCVHIYKHTYTNIHTYIHTYIGDGRDSSNKAVHTQHGSGGGRHSTRGTRPPSGAYLERDTMQHGERHSTRRGALCACEWCHARAREPP
jgi:hypothetical protein